MSQSVTRSPNELFWTAKNSKAASMRNKVPNLIKPIPSLYWLPTSFRQNSKVWGGGGIVEPYVNTPIRVRWAGTAFAITKLQYFMSSSRPGLQFYNWVSETSLVNLLSLCTSICEAENEGEDENDMQHVCWTPFALWVKTTKSSIKQWWWLNLRSCLQCCLLIYFSSHCSGPHIF